MTQTRSAKTTIGRAGGTVAMANSLMTRYAQVAISSGVVPARPSLHTLGLFRVRSR